MRLKQSIQSYTGDDRPYGGAFTSHKDYMTKAHGDYYNKFYEALTSFRRANDLHIRRINEDLRSDSKFCSVQIQGEIDRLDTEIRNLEFRIRATELLATFSFGTAADSFSTALISMNSTLHNLNVLRNGNLDRQRRLNAYVANTKGLYLEPERLRTEADRLLVRIESSVLCRIYGDVHMPTPAELDEIMQIRKMVDALFNEDETLDIVAVLALFDDYLTNGSDLHYRVLLELHLDTRFNNDNVIALYTQLGDKFFAHLLNSPTSEFAVGLEKRIYYYLSSYMK